MKYKRFGLILWLLTSLILTIINLAGGLAWIAGSYYWDTFVINKEGEK